MFADLRPLGLAPRASCRAATVAIGDFAIALRLELRPSDLERQIEELYGHYEQLSPASLPDLTVTLRPEPRRLTLAAPAVQVLASGEAPFRAVPPRWVLPVMEATINWFIWSYLNRVLLLHAAVVERDGRAVIMAGPSGSGKSTLCTALLARGWRLLSDEIAMVQLEDGRLLPHPRPISLKNAAIDMMMRLLPDACLSRRFTSAKGTVAFMRPPPSSIAAAGESALPAAVVFPRYRADAAVELEPLERAPAFMRLIDCSANYLTLLETGFETLADLVEACDHYALEYASLDDAVGAIERVGEPPRGKRRLA